LRAFDMGGGLGIRYRHERPPTAAEFARAVTPQLKKMGLRILLEPGRFIVGNAGILVSRVIFTKESGGKRFVIQDGGMNDLIRPSLYGAYHQIVPLEINGRDAETVDVVGPLCESGDFFALDRKLPRMERGEYLALMCAGAYGYTLSSNYNARPRPAEVLIDGTTRTLIRRRETIEELNGG
ncbi:MAG TPA: diaminopimelate decarboxylase, partial [Bacteroidota bacterium]|nr:diaminopimelate decarboxylase [Bacteroidota bacterium]